MLPFLPFLPSRPVLASLPLASLSTPHVITGSNGPNPPHRAQVLAWSRCVAAKRGGWRNVLSLIARIQARLPGSRPKLAGQELGLVVGPMLWAFVSGEWASEGQGESVLKARGLSTGEELCVVMELAVYSPSSAPPKKHALTISLSRATLLAKCSRMILGQVGGCPSPLGQHCLEATVGMCTSISLFARGSLNPKP